MLVENGTLTLVYDRVVHDDYGLGRHLVLDPRSLLYTVERELVAKPKPKIRPAEHPPNITTLSQLRTGSCVGNAFTYALGAKYGASGIASLILDGLPLTTYDALKNEDFARQVYHLATQQDGVPGEWPPQDTGSSGLGACRALKAKGLIDGYRWATTALGIATLLQDDGVELGVPWFNAWFQPDAHGFIDADPSWQASGVAGGHEIYVRSLASWNERDPRKSVIEFDQSWGSSWGDHGVGRMTLATYNVIRNQADAKQILRKAA